MEAIIASAITGVLALVGVILTNLASNLKMQHKLDTHQAVTDEKLAALTKEVQKHNNFAQRMPAVEEILLEHARRLKNLEDI